MNGSCSRILAASLALSGSAGMTAASAAPDGPGTCAEPGSEHPATPAGAACRLADELEKSFVDPEQGKAYAAALRAHAAAGKYAGLSVDDAAKIMTADLQAVARRRSCAR